MIAEQNEFNFLKKLDFSEISAPKNLFKHQTFITTWTIGSTEKTAELFFRI